MKTLTFGLVALASILGACTTTGNMERNAGAGAAIGALAGAVIGNNTGSGDAGNGAVVGAVIGGTAGAVRGYSLDQRRDECATAQRGPTYRDRNGSYYYVIPGTNRTCWSRNQTPRGL
ncbi:MULTISPECIES: glycine zipper domain-containing protein [Alphaproteobacteria]|uniref:glycine zipper domain-containing protein n=1 Tax=Alphaproteobacteria TaxID=28211 RepID=UPI00078C4F77|nr:YMGG-like glycine zipper-containing protein [Aquidulcibacter sp.]AMS28417.1 hypothetical protein AEM38_01140 [Hyphomonadaceae bacterium UKL13-1]MCA3696564.1 glycine zipper 2TM domain-containing protein [Aquidulcibacter sp.]OYU33321.1 MAG: hypothetical protein CFE35_20980 [Novosphingobium sp. PASSN1]HCP64604.1 hypothetical protein [Hyphomonadaceae bacterium]